MELEWTKDLSVGNAIIDTEHRNLISMANDVLRGIRSKDTHALLHTFELLEGWLCTHFVNEEKIAWAINFPFEQHKLAQQYSLKELQHLKNELISKEGLWSDGAVKHFTGFLKNWMIDEHIVRVDMPMKAVLQLYDYNFWPTWALGKTGSEEERPRVTCGCGCGCDHKPRAE